MPFTFSHPAIVLPLAYLPTRWLSLTGLVVGSLTPDFEYFFRMRIEGDFSHTLVGIFLFDLPTGLILAFIFHNVVRDSLLANLPAPLLSRLMVFKKFNWNKHFRASWPAVIISIIIGAASHIFWDGFTHYDGYFAERIPGLKKIISLSNLQIELFRFLQHASTVVGIGVIAYAIFKLPRTVWGKTPISASYWLMVIGITLLVLAIRWATGFDDWNLVNLIVNICSAGMISLIVTPLVLRKWA